MLNPYTTKHYAALRIDHLVERVAYHTKHGDHKAAALFADYLVQALDHFALTDTHVVVGDHDPEPRADGYHYPNPEPRA